MSETTTTEASIGLAAPANSDVAHAEDTPVPAVRAMRADARRNRERILAAARLAYAEHGREVQIDEVAERAGVGIGTVYRHFPTKTALAGALASEHFESLCSIAEDALGAAGTPGQRFESLIWNAARLAERDTAIAEVLAVEPDAFDYVQEPLGRLRGMTSRLVADAVASGELRADATGDDVPAIMCGLGRVIATSQVRPGADWERFLTITLDGMRAGAPGANPR